MFVITFCKNVRTRELDRLRKELRAAFQVRTQHTAQQWNRQKAALLSGARTDTDAAMNEADQVSLFVVLYSS
jgi:hypothetical protein